MTDRVRIGPLVAVVFVSGFAALVYQVLWMKELRVLLGATAPAVAVTLAVFFIGLALGGRVLGRLVYRARRPLVWYAVLEVGVAISAASYFVLIDAYDATYAALYPLVDGSPALLLAVKLVIATVILLPPSFCMGGTLPVLSEYAVRSASSFGRLGALLYACNTAGAAAGAFAAGFLLPPALGFRRSYFVAIALSLAVAVAAWSLGRGASRGQAPATSVARLPWTLRALAFWSGFAALGLEVLWTQMFTQVLQNSVYTFACILVTFLVALALGSALAGKLMRANVDPRKALAVLCVVSGLAVAVSGPLFYGWTGGLGYLGGRSDFWGYVLRVFGTGALVILGPALVLGAVFPFLFRACEAFVARPGQALGDLVAINTFGAVLGSLCAGFVLLELVGMWGAIWVFAFGYFAIGVRLAGADWLRREWIPATAACFVIAVTVPFALPELSVRAGERVLSVRHGSGAITAVVETSRARRIKVNNHYTLGGTGARIAEELQAHLPLALHGRPGSVCFLGLGTGITAGGACPFPVQEIVVCELIEDVVHASREHFADYTRGLFDDARTEVRVEDGRQFLRGTQRRFDVIVADMFIPWRSGVGGMYTLEHFEAGRARLKPHGVFAQWIAAYQVSRAELSIIARTMLEVFPRVTLWRGGFSTRHAALLLVGHASERPFDAASAELTLANVQRPRAEQGANDIPLSPDELLEFYCADLTALRDQFYDVPINDDDGSIIEYRSPRTHRASRAGGRHWLRDEALIELLSEWTNAVPTRPSDYLERVPDGRSIVERGLARHAARLDD